MRTFDELSVMENPEIGGIYLAKKRFQEQLAKIWELFPAKKAKRRQTERGGKQMLTLGRALMPDPELLLMEELSLGLSPKLVSQMVAHLQLLNRQFIVSRSFRRPVVRLQCINIEISD